MNIFFKNIEIIYVIAGAGSLFINNNKFFQFGLFKIVRNILNKPNKIIFINPYDKIWFEKNFNMFGKTYLMPTEGVELIKKKKKFIKKKILFFLVD